MSEDKFQMLYCDNLVCRVNTFERGGHASGEVCPSREPDDEHKYWCRYPEDECFC